MKNAKLADGRHRSQLPASSMKDSGKTVHSIISEMDHCLSLLNSAKMRTPTRDGIIDRRNGLRSEASSIIQNKLSLASANIEAVRASISKTVNPII